MAAMMKRLARMTVPLAWLLILEHNARIRPAGKTKHGVFNSVNEISPVALAFGRDAEPWIDFDPARRRPAIGDAAAATAHPLASWAMMHIMRAGGSAVDAAVAAQAVLTVVEPSASGIGGGAIMLVHAGGVTHAVDGLSAAPGHVPARLGTDFDGRRVPDDRAEYGGRTAGVPGALRALEAAHARFGRLRWAALFDHAIALAEEGFPLAPYLARSMAQNPAIRDEALARALYCGGTGAALPSGSTLRNPALAATLRRIAAGGAAEFYEGETAADICAAVRNDDFPGTITMADMAGYRAVLRSPIGYAMGGMTVHTAPLPAYGGIAAGQIVGILAALGLRGIGALPDEDDIHLIAEAGRVAFADRAPYADPDFAPMETAPLLNPAYLAERARLIDPRRRTEAIPPGQPATPGGSMTSHLSAADGAGQIVSMTTTINQYFGARIAVDGFYLNNAMTNFAGEPMSGGRPSPNAMAPRKRPRTTIAPSIVLDAQGAPLAALGAGGGYRIIGTVANALLRLCGGMRDPQALLAGAHVLNWNGVTEIEPELARHRAALAARGHWIGVKRMEGGTQCVVFDKGQWLAGGDPRRDGVGMALRK
jgi:gamma-glutamyltranspeptidase/glutathione hydrolase